MSIWKNKQGMFFIFILLTLTVKSFFFTLYHEHQKEIISYLESTPNLCVDLKKKYISYTAIKVAKKIFQKSLTFYETNLTQ